MTGELRMMLFRYFVYKTGDDRKEKGKGKCSTIEIDMCVYKQKQV